VTSCPPMKYSVAGFCSTAAPAVPVGFRSRFFDKYASDGKSGGTGLGTYSARLLAEAQQGSRELEVDNEANLTRLRLQLPSRN
jgi:nitrogen-specific signal transduction histidine kinase